MSAYKVSLESVSESIVKISLYLSVL